ncbi:MAG: sugar ABC transporter permease [bacterium]
MTASAPRRTMRSIWRCRKCYAYLLPTFLFLLVFNYTPAVQAIRMALYDWNLGLKPTFVGSANFVELWHDPVMWKSFQNLLRLATFLVAVSLVMPLLAAELIFYLRTDRISHYCRVCFVIPMIVNVVVVWRIWRHLYTDIGPVSAFLDFIGRGDLVHGWLSDPATALWAVMFVGFPFVNGFFLLILYAGLVNISESVLESARLDGARGLRTLFSVHLPLIRPQIKIVAVLATIGAIQGFEQVYILTRNGGPGFETMLPGLYMYFNAFDFNRMGYACAIGVVLFAILIALTLLYTRTLRSEVGE